MAAADRAGWHQRLAALTAVAAFPLLLSGGWVTSTGSGLADPTWPSGLVRWGFLFKVSETEGGLLYELNHRTLGKVVGCLAIATVLAATFRERSGWLRVAAWGALAGVSLQGLLGGMRIWEAGTPLGTPIRIAHACLGQVVFAGLVALALSMWPRWRDATAPAPGRPGGKMFRLSCVLAGATLAQLVAGAFLRHTGRLLWVHVALALMIAAHALLVAGEAGARYGDRGGILWPSRILAGLVGAQVVLGGAAWWGAQGPGSGTLPVERVAIVATAHVGLGALVLACAVALALGAARACVRPGRPVEGAAA